MCLQISSTASASNRLADNDTTLFSTSIGTFNSNHKVVLTCVAWFEGTDSHVVSTYNNDTDVVANVTSSLVFYSRNANA